MKTVLIIGGASLAAYAVWYWYKQNNPAATPATAAQDAANAIQSILPNATPTPTPTPAPTPTPTITATATPAQPTATIPPMVAASLPPVTSMPVATPLIPSRVVADPVLLRPAPIVPQVFTPTVSLMPSPDAAKVAAVQAQQQGAYALYLKTHPLNVSGLGSLLR